MSPSAKIRGARPAVPPTTRTIERWPTSSAAETEALGRGLATRLPAGAVLLLDGELGSGKTVFVRGVAEGLGFAPADIQSPSYTLIHEHRAAGRELVHVDLYRLETHELAELGLEEVLAGPGWKFVEWAERLDCAPEGAWRVRLLPGDGPEDRVVELEAPHPDRT